MSLISQDRAHVCSHGAGVLVEFVLPHQLFQEPWCPQTVVGFRLVHPKDGHKCVKADAMAAFRW